MRETRRCPRPTFITVKLTGTTDRTVTSDASGAYVFSDLLDGPYTVKPELAGYHFNPIRYEVNVSGGDLTGKNFGPIAVAPTSTRSPGRCPAP